MKLEDPLNRVLPQQISALCRTVGLPTPEGVKQVGTPTLHAWYGLKFGSASGVPPHLFRLDLAPSARGIAVDHALAAEQSLKLVDGIPLGTEGQRLPDAIFGAPAALYRFQERSTGLRLMALQKGFWATVARDLGQTLARLADHHLPRPASRACNGRFVPARGSWRDEWAWYVSSIQGAAERMGLDYGPLSTRALAAIDDRLGALDEVSGLALVHGELKANSVEYTVVNGKPTLARVDGWDHAIVGDPLVEVAHLLTMPPAVMGPILAGMGRERAEAWLEPSALARIEAYHLTHCLSRTNFVATWIFKLGDVTAISALELWRFATEQALQPGFARARIEAALAHPEPEATADPGPKPDPARTRLRQALCVLRGDEVLQPELAPLVQAALGTCALATELDGEAHGAHLDEVAGSLINARPRLGVSLATEPIADRALWRRGLLRDLLGALNTSERTGFSSLSTAWLGLMGADLLDGTISDSVLRGLEALVRGLSVEDLRSPPTDPAQRALQAVTARAAVHWCASQGVEPDALAPVTARIDDALQDLADLGGLEAIPVPTDRFEDAELLALLADPSASREQVLTRPLLIAALRGMNGQVTLPAGAPLLIRLAGG